MEREGIEQSDGLMAAARALARRLHLPTTLAKFLVVGGIAFLINEAALFLFYDSPVFWFLPSKESSIDLGIWDPEVRLLIASVLAVEVAIVFQFNSHERWTFRHRRRKGWIVARFAKFNLSSIVSPMVSVATVNLLTPVIRDEVGLGPIAPYVSNAIGVGFGFSWNWVLNSTVIWPHHPPAQTPGEPEPHPLTVAYPLTAEAPEGQERLTS